ncbi:Tristetraprolin [Zancudomyces culisetae]|uniref:Tristetraprolin n=1 Tax=Zancudomyces culisetae TaxID=1213189 RepID=A0A1R1PQE7_ZANCU|nr:Tristetraprolin [Zancudomyces culisetae]|eukprot:OMH83178.1 Tristetraprolin [Zancudomyces culisetae]
MYGTCRYGDSCKFAHGLVEQRRRERNKKYKTSLCKDFPLGKCTFGIRCNFAHSINELNPIDDPSKNKTKPPIKTVESEQQKLFSAVDNNPLFAKVLKKKLDGLSQVEGSRLTKDLNTGVNKLSLLGDSDINCKTNSDVYSEMNENTHQLSYITLLNNSLLNNGYIKRGSTKIDPYQNTTFPQPNVSGLGNSKFLDVNAQKNMLMGNHLNNYHTETGFGGLGLEFDRNYLPDHDFFNTYSYIKSYKPNEGHRQFNLDNLYSKQNPFNVFEAKLPKVRRIDSIDALLTPPSSIMESEKKMDLNGCGGIPYDNNGFKSVSSGFPEYQLEFHKDFSSDQRHRNIAL